MSITTANEFEMTHGEHEQGFWTRLGHRVIESRKMQADRAVAAYLLSLDDETLNRLGYDRAEVEARDPKAYPFI